MIDFSLFFGFLAASTVLIAIPGPNVMLIAVQSAAHGRRAGLFIVLGLTTGQALQVSLVLLGLSALLSLWASGYVLLKILGGGYLLWLAIQAFLHAKRHIAYNEPLAPPTSSHLFRRGVLVALANPKTMLFHAAFLPQFVSGMSPVVPQLIVLAISFLLIAWCLDSVWAMGFGSLQRVIKHPVVQNGLNWVSGGVYLVMGILVLTRRSPG
ncbi:MAG: lysine transporter LysE [Robiginitomaculum sp.]|nr:MAG: lysine transporter LysE [Robiginitomaculum sp.]